MLNPARPNSWMVASCSEPFGMPSLSFIVCLPRACSAVPVARVCVTRSCLRDPSGCRLDETGPLAGVADIAVAEALHLQQHGVVVAIGEQLGDLQAVARCL